MIRAQARGHGSSLLRELYALIRHGGGLNKEGLEMTKFLMMAAMVLSLGATGCLGDCECSDCSRELEPDEDASTDAGVDANDPIAGWKTFHEVHWAIEMRYPPQYETVLDTYGWPHAMVHFVEMAGAQSYRAQIETWEEEGEDDFRATYGREPAFIVEHPNGKNWVTVDYNPDPANPAVDEEWQLAISTFRFTAP